MLKTSWLRALVFPLTCVVVFALGGLLRLQPWRPAPEVKPTEAVEVVSWVALPPGLGETIFLFYDKVDRGQYGEAYDLSLEVRWEALPDGSYRNVGLTPRQEFVDALTAELGQNGVNLNIVAKQILAATPLPLDSTAMADRPELTTLAYLSAGQRPTSLYEVDVTGVLGDVCTPLRFDRRLTVAEFAKGKWKLLLPGGSRPGNARKDEWFTNGDSFAGKLLLNQGKTQ